MKTKQLFFLFIIGIGMIFTCFHSATAQQSSQGVFIEFAEVQNFPQIRLTVHSWDQHGKPRRDLIKEQITIQEDDGEPFFPDRIEVQTTAPLTVVLVLDASQGMMGKPLDEVKAATARFLDRIQEGDEVALIALGGEMSPELDDFRPGREVPFGAPLPELFATVEGLQAEGQTLLYDGLAKAVRLVAQKAPGHRAVVLISDGKNEPAERGDPNEALRLAEEERIPIYVIGYGRRSNLDLTYLQQVAYSSGGFLWLAPNTGDLNRLFTEMVDTLRSRILVEYTSHLLADGQEHWLTLTLKTAEGEWQSQVAVRLPYAPIKTEPALTETVTEQPPTHTITPIPPVTTTATPPIDGNGNGTPWIWLVGGGLVGVLFIVGMVFLLRRIPEPQWVCARCGYSLSEGETSCPQCGETRKLPKRQ